jgi:acetyl-CoA decarbonylase/synthase complex subunit delta
LGRINAFKEVKKLAFEISQQPYTGKIGEVILGKGPAALKLGGEDSYPFYLFEGNMPNPPKIGMEIWDYDPSEEWPAGSLEPFRDVVSSPADWARKCVEDYGADLIVFQLKSTDPNAMDRGADESVRVVREVLDAIHVPLVVWGTGNNQKDEQVLKKISEACEGRNLVLGPVEEGCYKGVGASALGYGHTVGASSPIDVNLAKQLNILLGNLGLKLDRIVIDPTTGGLGYGLEYSYSVMERIRMAALTQEDEKLQCPIICGIGNEVWKSKEAALSIDESPSLGDTEKRGILMETVSAVCYLLSGADVVVLRHPESVRLTRSFIGLMVNGGMATQVQEISKRLPLKEADLLSISPEPDLSLPKEEPKPSAKPREEKPESAPRPEGKVVELKPRPEAKLPDKAEEELGAEAEAKVKAEALAEQQAKARASAEAKAKADEEMRAKAEAEARAKAQEEARIRAQAEAKVKAEEEARRRVAEAKAREKEALQELRYKRALAREKHEAGREAHEAGVVARTRAAQQLDLVDKLISNLDRIHRRG